MPQLSGWTILFVFDDQGRVLLIRRAPHKKLLPGVVNGVGGRIDPHDRTPQDAATRELSEESGLSPGPLRQHGTMLIQRNYSAKPAERMFIYLFSTRTHTGKLKNMCPEGELFWCPLAEVPKHRFSPEFDLYWPHLLDGEKVFHVWAEYDDDRPGKLVLM